jgi:hypothetical protein
MDEIKHMIRVDLMTPVTLWRRWWISSRRLRNNRRG